MESIEDLLAQVKAQGDRQNSKLKTPSPKTPESRNQPSSSMNKQNRESSAIDDLLSEVKSELDSEKPQSQSRIDSLTDNLLNQVKTEVEQEKQQSFSRPSPLNHTSSESSSSRLDDLLAEVESEVTENKPNQAKPQNQVPPPQQVKRPSKPRSNQHSRNFLGELKSEFEEKQREEEKLRQEQLQEQQRQEQLRQKEQQRQAQLREQRRRKALESKAKEWLKNLHPNSEEGLWFEDFSYSYESKLEAAIDYLEALRETRSI
ncbi:MAG: hypothetical protein SAK42_00420 [Oscillatoria sp. PMC 1076.18]|nr:hypothetical protein [Oscillatoria sp. PMC 1076.18]